MNPALAVDPELPRRRLDVDEYHRMGEAVTPDRLPPGVLGAWMRSREPKGANGKRPPAILESTRWVEGHERACEQASTMPDTRLVYVADREADMGELLTRGAHLGWPIDMLVRSSHDRALPEEGGRLWAAVLGNEPLGGINFTLATRHGVKARPVHQELYARRVSIRTGRSKRSAVEMTCLIVREVDVPPGTKPIEWRLLTNRTIETRGALVELIDGYRARREVEMLFNILKTGVEWRRGSWPRWGRSRRCWRSIR